MLKSGLIFGVASLVVAILVTLVLPYCVPCVAPFIAVGAGYLASVFDKPSGQEGSAKSGAGAGAIGGVGSLLGHLLGGALNALVVGPERAMEIIRQLGLPAGSLSPTTYYSVTFGLGCCLGLLEIALMAGAGALGGLLWYQITGRNMAGGAPPMPGMSA